jgi:acetolactate synthase-1/2/3 large subunit
MDKLAAAFDYPFVRANNHSDMRAAIEATLARPGRALCEVMLDLDQVFAPKLASRRLPDGRMVSSPLEDLAPFLPREELRANMLIPLVQD